MRKIFTLSDPEHKKSDRRLVINGDRAWKFNWLMKSLESGWVITKLELEGGEEDRSENKGKGILGWIAGHGKPNHIVIAEWFSDYLEAERHYERERGNIHDIRAFVAEIKYIDAMEPKEEER